MPHEIIISASSSNFSARRLYIAESRTLCILNCIRIPLSRGRTHVTMRTKSCTGKRLYGERNRIECNLSPGYTARFVARSLSVKLNSRRNSTRYTRGIPPPGACSPVVSLYSRPAKKEMPMGAAARHRRGWASFVSSLSSLSRLHLPPFRFMLLYVPPWRTVELTDFSEPISRRFCSLGPTFTVLWWPRQSSRRRHGATLGPVRTW